MMAQVTAPETEAGGAPSAAQRLREGFARFEVRPDLGELLLTNDYGVGEFIIKSGVRHWREGTARAPERSVFSVPLNTENSILRV